MHYLAPERLAGQSATPAVDLYGVGVLLYLMLTGRLPFVGDDLAAIIAQHQQRSPRPPSELRPDLPNWLEQAVLRALAKEPGERFASADAMESSLRRGRREAADLATVRIAVPGARKMKGQDDGLPTCRHGLSTEGGSERARRTTRGSTILLAVLVVLAVLGLIWGLARQGGVPASSPTVVPTSALQAPGPAIATSTVPPATATRAIPPGTPTAAAAPLPPATAAPAPSAAVPAQTLDGVRALVANSDASLWKGDKKREFLKQLDELRKKLAEAKHRETRDRVR